MPQRLLALLSFVRTFLCCCVWFTLGGLDPSPAQAQDDAEPLFPPEEPVFPETDEPDAAPTPPSEIDPLDRDLTEEEPVSPADEATDVGEIVDDQTAEGEETEAFSVPEEMKVFSDHVGYWRGLSKSVVDEDGQKNTSSARAEWRGGYLMGGHLFEVRGYEYGDLGRTQYHWQYSFDRLKERYLAVYRDAHGRTFFFEGVTNEEGTKIVWRLVIPPGDMRWETETDLVTEDGIETKGTISSEQFGYNRMYTAVFKRK